MTYNLRPAIKPRERILTFGVQGTGKSTAILEVARRCPTDTFHVLDTDYGNYDRLLATSFSDLNNVEVTVVDEWQEFLDETKRIQGEMRVDDWLTIDMMTQSWPAVQAWFTEQIFGQEIDEYFLEVRKKKASMASKGDEKKALGALDGWMDWPVINKVYFKFYNLLLKTPGHLYLAAEQDAVQGEDSKEVKAAFGPYGVKPKGQKKLGHIPSSVLWLTKSRVDGYAMTTIKDRGRVEVEDVAVNNFATDYLMKVASWRPAKIGEAE